MKTACTGRPAESGTARSVSNESIWLPKALRRTVTSSPPKVSWPAMPSVIRSASRISPAHVPYTGMPAAIAARMGSLHAERPRRACR